MKYEIIKHGTVYASEGIFGYTAWPTVAKAPDGTLLVACSAFRMRHVCPFGKTALMRSRDGGETWSAPMPVIDTSLDDRDGGLCVFNDKIMVTGFNNSIAFQYTQLPPNTRPHTDEVEKRKDEMGLAYCGCLDPEVAERQLGSTYRISADGGHTFGEVGLLPVTSPHGPCQLRDGRLFYVGRAFSSPESNPQITYHHPNKHKRVGVQDALAEGLYYIFSSDEGRTWSAPRELPHLAEIWSEGRFCCEPHAIQLRSGRILVHIRVERWGDKPMFATYQCYSDDNGETFSSPTVVAERGAPSHLLQLADGRVLCTYGYRSAPYGQRARLSTDDGQTWSDEILLRDDGENWDLGYPSTVELDSGELLTVYYQRPGRCRNTGIYYTRWRLD